MADRHGLSCRVYTRFGGCDWGERRQSSAGYDDSSEPLPDRDDRRFAAGATCFGEKPMAESMEEARELIQLADEAGKSYLLCKIVGMMPIFAPSGSLMQSRHDWTRWICGCGLLSGPHFGGFRERWKARSFWIWRSIRSTRPVYYGQTPLRYTAMNSTRPAPGMPAMRRRSASLRCQTAPSSATAAPGARKVRRRHGRPMAGYRRARDGPLGRRGGRTRRSCCRRSRRQVHSRFHARGSGL